MKKVIWGVFVISMFALASCGGSQSEQQKQLDSLSKALDESIKELNNQLDSLNVALETTDTTEVESAE